MNVAYVLVRTHKRRILEVHHALSRLPSVREVHPLGGEWDLIVKVDASPALSGADLLFTITNIEGVTESKRLGVARIGADTGAVSNLSNTQMRSDAL